MDDQFSEDFRDLLSALSDAEARYLVVGGYAVAIHGHARATKDLDVWVEPTADNARRVRNALVAFGANVADLSEADLATPGTAFMMGRPPTRIDILTRLVAVEFADAWTRSVEVEISRGLRARFLGLQDLLANKRAAARPQDLADVDALERAPKRFPTKR